MDALHTYLHAFGHLSRGNGKAPHKPILLLSVLDEIGRGNITGNEIVLTVELVAAFREYWQTLPLPPGNWQDRIFLPYRHLSHEGFWELMRDGVTLTKEEVGGVTSFTEARTRTHFARFAPALWLLLQDAPTRDALRAHLLQTYFHITPAPDHLYLPADPLAAQVDRLIAEAQSRPKPKTLGKVKEGDVVYLRHALFPKVVTTVYDNACAVCSLHVQIATFPVGGVPLRGGRQESRVLQAVHIRPFAEFHDDHPSNGLALCHNHHWAFDRGGFSVADDYTLLASPLLTGTAGFVPAGAPLFLPTSDTCYPDLAALAWHRAHVFRG